MKPLTMDVLVKFEKRVADLWHAGKINAPVHLSGGNELALTHVFDSIEPEDWVVSTHRNHYHYLMKGGSDDKLIDELVGRESGLCHGNSRSMHTIDLSINFISSAIVAGGCSIAVGLAIACKMKKIGKVVCFVGDGAVEHGMFWESLVVAESCDLPITFVVEDNDRSVETDSATRGTNNSWTRAQLKKSPKVVWYTYKPTYPHVGTGVHVSF